MTAGREKVEEEDTSNIKEQKFLLEAEEGGEEGYGRRGGGRR